MQMVLLFCLRVPIKILLATRTTDNIILSESKDGLQNALDIFESYCEIWKLQVNVNKTKVMTFCKKKLK